ncbi:MAG: phosphoesterase, partial [Nevskia sp.]|nr:phosphoesterase [Nevskia sp.]
PIHGRQFPTLNHVWVVMMENHGYGQIIGNPNAPFINQIAADYNSANNYFAVGHPSLTNYLEVVGGSNFGVQNDNSPDWHNAACMSNIANGTVSNESTSTAICPIAGANGTDAPTPAKDCSNEVSGPPCELNIDGVKPVAAFNKVDGMTIADQLEAHHRSWKSYQESLPPEGADGVNSADGFFSNLNPPSALSTPNITFGANDLVALYAVKHNPFVYFKSIQQDSKALGKTVGLEELYLDIAGHGSPEFSFIAPNQCNDQHGRGNTDKTCTYDPVSDGSQTGLNPALIQRGDVTVKKIVTSIMGAREWSRGSNAIVVLWDENDYGVDPETNQVPLIVITNYKTSAPVHSNSFYTHFSLLKTIEAGLGLPCLNHACDGDVQLMNDLFAP